MTAERIRYCSKWNANENSSGSRERPAPGSAERETGSETRGVHVGRCNRTWAVASHTATPPVGASETHLPAASPQAGRLSDAVSHEAPRRAPSAPGLRQALPHFPHARDPSGASWESGTLFHSVPTLGGQIRNCPKRPVESFSSGKDPGRRGHGLDVGTGTSGHHWKGGATSTPGWSAVSRAAAGRVARRYGLPC